MALELFLRLELSEKTLIDDFCSVFEPNSCLIDVSSDEEVNQTFSAWRWTRQVRSELRNAMTSEEMQHFHDGKRDKMMELFLTHLPRKIGWGDPLYNKFSGLLAENEKFFQEFSKSTESSVSVIPKEVDLSYWKRLSKLYRSRLFDYSLCSDLDTFGNTLYFGVSYRKWRSRYFIIRHSQESHWSKKQPCQPRWTTPGTPGEA